MNASDFASNLNKHFLKKMHFFNNNKKWVQFWAGLQESIHYQLRRLEIWMNLPIQRKLFDTNLWSCSEKGKIKIISKCSWQNYKNKKIKSKKNKIKTRKKLERLMIQLLPIRGSKILLTRRIKKHRSIDNKLKI